MADDTPPLQITIRPPAVQAKLDANPQLTGDINGGAPNGSDMVDASSILSDHPLPQSPNGTAAPAYAPTEVPQGGSGTVDAADVLKEHPFISADMSDKQILHAIGLPNDRVDQITNDPTYKALNAIEPDFLSKEVADPNSTIPLLKNNPAFGALVQSGDESAFGIARLLTHALNSAGAVPNTTTDLMDAWSKVNDIAWQGRNGIALQDYQANYTVPKIAGAVALGAAGGLIAAPAAIARGVTGALGGAADATLAAGATNAVATPLAASGGVAKGLAGAGAVGASGAVQAAAYANPHVDFTADPQTRQNQYWQQAGNDAKQGALLTLLFHGALKGAVSGHQWAVSKSKNAKAIADHVSHLMSHVPTTQQGYQYFMDKFAPLFSKPEYAEREANFAAHGVQPKLSQVTHGGGAKFIENTIGGLPFGMARANAKQEAQLEKVAQKYSSDLYDRMINTKFEGVEELQAAAKSDGPKSKAAQRVLEEMQQAGLTPARMAQLSASGKDIREWLISRKKFAKVQALAGDAKLPVEKPLAKVNQAIINEAGLDNPNAAYLTKLTKIKQNLEGPSEFNTWAKFNGRMRSISEMIESTKSSGAKEDLIEIQTALEQAQHDFAENVHKYAKSERYGILAKDTAPYFKASKGEGYNFPAMRPVSAEETEPGVRMFATPQGAAQSGEWMTGHTVKLKSPVIVEGAKGLSEFKAKLGLDPAVKFKSADDLKAEWDAITEKATQYAKSTGHDGVVFTKNGEPQSVIDMTKWKKQIGNDATDALRNYRKNVGAQGSALRNARESLTTANPDGIINNALDKRGAETATNYYNSLDSKGQAALRVTAINQAIKQGVDKDGNIDPAKIAKYFRDRQDAVNVFFKGENRWVLNGFTNLMSEAKAHGSGGHGITGSIVMAEAAMEAIKDIGHIGSAIETATLSFGAMATVGTIARTAATNPQLRYFLVAASDAKPGSPAMQKIYDKIMDIVDKTAAATAAKQGDKK